MIQDIHWGKLKAAIQTHIMAGNSNVSVINKTKK
jgi:hypothetical protein